MTDSVLGGALGSTAGIALRTVFFRAWQFGWTLLGPYRVTEGAVLPGSGCAMRTAGRSALAIASAGIASSALFLVLSLPARPFVDSWRQFILTWGVACALGAIAAKVIGGRRAV
jgi:hypothetical protein